MPGVYISYPFCRQKCTYCNFASGVQPASLSGDYMTALGDEIRRHDWQWTPDTLYLGGGSPDLIDADSFGQLIDAIPGRPWAEATLEASPGDISPENAALWSRSGINRVSLGVQSFVDSEIRQTGRKHTADTVAADVALLRDTGIPQINIDLIAGLPGQTSGTWAQSLDWLFRLNADHASVYMLEVDDDSRLGRELMSGGKRYGAPLVPDDTITAELYTTAAEQLRRMGFHRYEISNFARPGRESIHNLKYWRFSPYAGFGADAHSFDGTTRRENARDILDYLRRWRDGQPVSIVESLARPGEELFFVSLRLMEGVEPSSELAETHSETIQRFVERGLLQWNGPRLSLTNRGVLLSNEVFQEFITT